MILTKHQEDTIHESLSEILRLLDQKRIFLQDNLQKRKFHTSMIEDSIKIMIEALKHGFYIHDTLFPDHSH